MIYELTLNGYGRTAISKRLNELGILNPTGHRAIDLKMRIPFKNNTDKVTYSWCSTTIRDILRNQMYCGDLVQNKGKLISYKIHKRVLVPQEEWIIVKDTHDAIIDRDTIFTTEYSIRTAMEAFYTLLNVDRGVSEVWGSVYDIRDLLNATVKLRDGKKATDMDMNLPQRMAVKELLKKIEGTDIELILKQYNVI